MLLFIAPLVTIFQSTLLNFNTSHVTVYPYGILHYYLFVSYFNTSHVTVYPLQLCTALGPSLISIHLMLLFIASALFLLPPFGIISIHLMLLFISVDWDAFAASVGFQYISCYCLSHLLHELFLSVMPFQYISCYCLSSPPLPVLHSLFHFNTSHVTVYLINLWFCQS